MTNQRVALQGRPDPAANTIRHTSDDHDSPVNNTCLGGVAAAAFAAGGPQLPRVSAPAEDLLGCIQTSKN